MKKIISIMMTVIIIFSLASAAFAAESGIELRMSTPELEELISAVELGFGDSVDDVSGMTYKDYCEMLAKLADAIEARDSYDRTDNFTAWKTKYSGIAENSDTLTRINAMYMIYTLAHDVLGETYDQPNCAFYMPNGQTWNELHLQIEGEGYVNSVWNEVFPSGGGSKLNGMFYDAYAGNPEDANYDDWSVSFDGKKEHRQVAGYYFSFGRVSVSGWPLFEYDANTNSMRVTATLTMREAMLSCLRLYESVEQFDMTLGQTYEQYDVTNGFPETVLSYCTDIITPALLERADYMPMPAVDDLPYYTGVHHSWIGTDAEPMESAFRNYAELGFNYVRLDLTCKNFFGIGTDVDNVSDVPGGILSTTATAVTKVDVACLTKLDEMISWGLKYGLHIALQFSDHPGHIQFLLRDGSTADTDFYWNETKQEQTALMWQTIAKRYESIPSSTLSFIINHEPFNINRSTAINVTRQPTKEEIVTAASIVANAVKSADPDRFMYYHSSQGMHVDSFMTDKELVNNLGLAQMFNCDKREFSIWNLITDVDFSSGYYPDWPCYVIPSRLTYFTSTANPEHRPSLTIDGFLPKDTKFDIKMKSDGPLTVTAKNVSGGSVELANAELATTGGTSADRSFTLPDGVISVTLALTGNSYVDFQSFCITLPSQYSKKHYYTDSTNNWQHQLLEDSKLDIKLSSNSDNVYNYLTSAALNSGFEHCWVLDETPGKADLTITRDETTNACSYTSNYGYNQETLDRAAELYAAEQKACGTAGMNVEFFCSPYNTQSEVTEFYDALLSSYEKYGIGWALYFNHTLYTAFYAGAEQTFADGSGLRMNAGIPEALQKHLAARPRIMVSVPTSESGCRLSFSVYNSHETEAEFTVVAASCDGSGHMVDVDLKKVTAAANSYGQVSLSLSGGATISTIKIFQLGEEYAPECEAQLISMT